MANISETGTVSRPDQQQAGQALNAAKPGDPVARLRVEPLKNARSFVRHWNHIEQLRSQTGLSDEVLLDPLHFLTTMDNTRRSRSVACWRGEQLIALMYVTEFILGGIPTGYAVGGDYSGRGLLMCKPEFEALVITEVIQHLTANGIHTLHLRLQPRDTANPMLPGLSIRCLDGLIPGTRMPLAPDFPEFLKGLGKHTRRNIRNYMRKTAQANLEFVTSLPLHEYRAGVDRLNGEAIFQANRGRLARDERLLTLHSGAQRFGLRSADGTLVAVLCGFTQGKSFYLMTQLNDPHLPHLSLSLALRGYMVEHLISLGYEHLQFIGGASLSLGRYCLPHEYRSIFVDKKRGLAACLKWLGCETKKLIESLKRPIPEGLKTICNGNLQEWELIERTALGPAALVFRNDENA